MLPLNQPDTAEPGPDFRHVDTWIFDLDNTLYRADSNLFAQIDQRMTDYIARHLSVTVEAAWQLQHSYYREYGSTLSGLIRLNNVDPETFLAYVHDIDLSPLTPDEALIAAIDRLPGRRFVFTNGCRHHAKRVLDRLGLSEAVTEIWDIRTLDFTPKPQAEAYHRVITTGAFEPKSAAMFEDMARNLMPAYALGMTTVWINNGSEWSHQGPEYPLVARRHIHHEIDDLAEFLHAIRI
ncbi:MAG: pyrimidine 5'-nucleotidase [Alphaproteobacteria bacterium]|nr:pyrimidine 5'-nucleotidase [Alphaproteobacteria bacterium]MDE1987869.1 pyrimidine 5'-nucleotidase [Alphaproteobacteria bacterium]MDE2162649.1 pyrimidine 5'-nucleotidase [Alphaproteobacteria bacterium]MDE2266978.1 pyrimidine 5'-nucleotidase [Alphaproteobacteria bacterium]MDE2499565.1 pyrimidine 5'-nucleotidase [Alphaproteobacteria bacterium]